MASLQELTERFINEPDKISPDECRRLLEMLGYSEKKKPGSETVFHKKGASPINVPAPKRGKYVKSPYIKRIVKLLDLENYLEGAEGNEAD